MADPVTNKKVAGEVSGAEEMLIRLESSTHVSSLTKKLEEQFLNQSMVDVALVTEEGQFIYAHKFILSAGSPYFKNMIENSGKAQLSQNSSVPLIICLLGVKHKHLYPLIKYVYTGCVDIPQDDLKVLVKTAVQLKISGLYEEAEHKEKYFESFDPSAFGGSRGLDDVEEFPEDGDTGSNDLSIEAFVKSEQESYDMDEVESHESMINTGVGDPLSFHDVLRKSPLPGPGIDRKKYVVEAAVLTSCPPPPLTKGSPSTNNFPVVGTSNVRGRKPKLNPTSTSFPYHCTKCGNGYNCAKSMWRHRKFNCPATEIGNKITFVCKICAKGFSRADNLKRHTLVYHNSNTNNTPA